MMQNELSEHAAAEIDGYSSARTRAKTSEGPAAAEIVSENLKCMESKELTTLDYTLWKTITVKCVTMDKGVTIVSRWLTWMIEKVDAKNADLFEMTISIRAGQKATAVKEADPPAPHRVLE